MWCISTRSSHIENCATRSRAKRRFTTVKRRLQQRRRAACYGIVGLMAVEHSMQEVGDIDAPARRLTAIARLSELY